jgi:preprotein translocase subunit YajC
MNTLYDLLAQTAPTSQPVAPGPTDFLRSPLIPLILVIVVFWWVMSRGRNKERQRYDQMLGALKKNDRVQTIGGVLGTVVDVRDNEVVLKVDEASNVKMRFNRTAIKEVLRDAPPSSTDKS